MAPGDVVVQVDNLSVANLDFTDTDPTGSNADFRLDVTLGEGTVAIPADTSQYNRGVSATWDLSVSSDASSGVSVRDAWPFDQNKKYKITIEEV